MFGFDFRQAQALADLHTPLNIATLCRVLTVGERTLRNAFHRIHGLPPHRYLRMLKLSRARQELMLVRGQSVTVTEIATDLGFVELGRFSVEYRRMFGESPSETLRQAAPDRRTQNMRLSTRRSFTRERHAVCSAASV